MAFRSDIILVRLRRVNTSLRLFLTMLSYGLILLDYYINVR